MHVAVIDDGINEGLYNVGPLIHNIEITSILEIRQRSDYNIYSRSHGTICSAVIKNYYRNAVFSSIKVLSTISNRGNLGQIIKAIEWCISNEIHIVNMSLGTIYFTDFKKLKQAINFAYEKGIIFIAACNNHNIVSYPASFTNVIGVKRDLSKLLKEEEYEYNLYPVDNIEITAYSRPYLVNYAGEGRFINPSNSFTAPFITALVCKIIEENPGIKLENIKKKLYEGSKNFNGLLYLNIAKNIDWVNEANVFILGNYDHNNRDLFFDFDVKSLDVFEDCNLDDIRSAIERVARYSNSENISTFIFIIKKSNIALLEENIISFITKTLRIPFNIIFISNSNRIVTDDKIFNNEIRIWHPHNHKYFNNYLERDFNIDVPIIVVYSFIDSGMIEIMKKLSDNFRSEGYYPFSITDNSQGILAGLEYIDLDNNLKKNEVFKFAPLKTIYKVNKPDVLILGIEAKTKNNGFFMELENNLEIDIKILLIDRKTEQVNDIIHRNKNSELIICSSGNIINDGFIKNYNYFDKGYVKSMYKHINDLLH